MEQLERGQMGGSPEARDGRAVREGISWQRPRRTFGFGSREGLWREPGGRGVSVV